MDSGKLNEKQQEMFEYADQVVEYTGDTPDPDPMGISEAVKSLQIVRIAHSMEILLQRKLQKNSEKEANEILERNN